MQDRAVKLLHPDADHFVILHTNQCKNIPQNIQALINQIGIASSNAQGLNHVITSYSSFMTGENTIYLLLDDQDSMIVGFIKIGSRRLFLWDKMGVQHELKTVCLLDFFTYPNCQRKGYGKKMIDRLLKDENKGMEEIPIDKPSPLCLSFMKKHFGLSNFIPQNNNYVVFDQFWESPTFLNKTVRNNQYCPKPLLTPNPKSKPKITAPRSNQYHRSPQPKRTQLNPITWLPYD